jgi:hypothetical protein
VGFTAEAVLLGLEERKRDVVGVEQFVAFGVECGQSCGVPAAFIDGAALTGGDLGL